MHESPCVLGDGLLGFFMTYVREPVKIKHFVFMNIIFVNGAFVMAGKFRDTQVPEFHAYVFQWVK